jgi:hypothetical protein
MRKVVVDDKNSPRCPAVRAQRALRSLRPIDRSLINAQLSSVKRSSQPSNDLRAGLQLPLHGARMNFAPHAVLPRNAHA